MRNEVRLTVLALLCGHLAPAADLHVNELGYLDMQGLSVLAYQNQFHDVFRDQKLGGIEIILHGERIATDGEVRLLPTPEQWDTVPKFTERRRGPSANQLVAYSGYPDLEVSYRIEVTAEAQGFRIAVHLDHPLPQSLVGKAGFNLDFLPTAYFGKSYLLDHSSGIFPRHPIGPMQRGTDGAAEPTPLGSGRQIVLSPEDPLTRVSIHSDGSALCADSITFSAGIRSTTSPMYHPWAPPRNWSPTATIEPTTASFPAV
jgi:endoglucanase